MSAASDISRATLAAANLVAEKSAEVAEFARAAEALTTERTDAMAQGREPDWRRALHHINADVCDQIVKEMETTG